MCKIDANTFRELCARSTMEGVPMSTLLKKVQARPKPKPQPATPPSILEPKVTKRNGHPESDLQRQCVEWFRTQYADVAPLLFHPNNEPYFGGKGRSKAKQSFDGYMATQMGVVKGVADLILLAPSYDGRYHGLCIEMKSAKGVQRDSQKDWQKAVEAQGFRYEVVRDFVNFRLIVREHLHS